MCFIRDAGCNSLLLFFDLILPPSIRSITHEVQHKIKLSALFIAEQLIISVETDMFILEGFRCPVGRCVRRHARWSLNYLRRKSSSNNLSWCPESRWRWRLCSSPKSHSRWPGRRNSGSVGKL